MGHQRHDKGYRKRLRAQQQLKEPGAKSCESLARNLVRRGLAGEQILSTRRLIDRETQPYVSHRQEHREPEY